MKCLSMSSKASTASTDGNESFDTCCSSTPVYIKIESTGEEWIKPTTLDALFEVVGRLAGSSMKYRLVAGNTGTGGFNYPGS